VTKVASFIQLAVIHLILSSCGQNPTEVKLTKWIAKNANHINTVEAGNGFEDLIPFGVNTRMRNSFENAMKQRKLSDCPLQIQVFELIKRCYSRIRKGKSNGYFGL
jgi:hypothetical protein